MPEQVITSCAKCPGPVCNSASFMKGPANCPTQVEADVIAAARSIYHEPEFAEFARVSTWVESSGFQVNAGVPETVSPKRCRLEEIILFSRKMGYRKLGVAFCMGLINEARILIPILENKGFEVVSVGCKTGGIPKEEVNLRDEEKVHPGRYEVMCNPISQAGILNKEGTEFNIMLGLCIGHDALFLKHVKALTTVFAVKDRMLGHNPVAALYLSNSYYRRLLAKDAPSPA